MRRTDPQGKTRFGRMAFALVSGYIEALVGLRDGGPRVKQVAFVVLRLDEWERADSRWDEIERERCGQLTFERLCEHISRIGLPLPPRAEIEARAAGRDPNTRLIASLRAAQATLVQRHGDPDNPHVRAIAGVIRAIRGET